MDITTLLILIVIFVIIASIANMIHEMKYKLVFYMVIALASLTIMNIYLAITYYISLRDDPGIQGPQGNVGPQGITGAPGHCTYSDSCGIPDARNLILTTANRMYNIAIPCIDSPSISTCGNQSTLDQATPINAQINLLEQIAYTTTMAQTDFMSKINLCLQDPQNCSEDVQF
uniref:Uncharacterized protein n=1 Tax=viral metagenome TaxID=1070528 RepID=A0A6C0HNC2_9ZZZZ